MNISDETIEKIATLIITAMKVGLVLLASFLSLPIGVTLAIAFLWMR